MKISSKKQKKAKKFDINICYLLMSIIIIAALIIIFKTPISNDNKMLTLAGLLYIFVACIFLNDNTDISREILGVELEDKEPIRTGYLNLMIESLEKANFYMNKITMLDDYSRLDIDKYLKNLKAIYFYLKTVNPPVQYNYYHENVICQFETFFKKYNVEMK